MVALNSVKILTLYTLCGCLAIIAYLVWVRYQLKYLCTLCILGHFVSILLFPAPPHHQYGKFSRYCWCILIIYIYGRYLGFQMLWLLFSECYFMAWKYDMLAKMQCLCYGANNNVYTRNHDPWSIPYIGIGWTTGWYLPYNWSTGVYCSACK